MNDKVYIHEFIDIIGHNRVNYMHHMTANWSPIAQDERHQLCYGVWAVIGTTREWPQVVNLWEEDGFQGLASPLDQECNNPSVQDPKLAKWWAEAANYRSRGVDRVLVPAPWTRTIEELCAEGVRGDVYAHEQFQLPQGTSASFLDAVRDEAVDRPREVRLGACRAWETAMVNESECFLLWAIPTFEQWGEVEAASAPTPASRAGGSAPTTSPRTSTASCSSTPRSRRCGPAASRHVTTASRAGTTCDRRAASSARERCARSPPTCSSRSVPNATPRCSWPSRSSTPTCAASTRTASTSSSSTPPGSARDRSIRAARARVVDDRGSVVHFDGGLGFGQPCGVQAIDLGIERAREHGIASVIARETTHLGALGYYTRRAAEAGCVALAFQNGPTFVPPFGPTTRCSRRTRSRTRSPPRRNRPSSSTSPPPPSPATGCCSRRGAATRRFPRGGRTTSTAGPPPTPSARRSISSSGSAVTRVRDRLPRGGDGGCRRGEQLRAHRGHRVARLGGDRVAKGFQFVVIDVERFMPGGRFRARSTP